jgi:hypothetical protein
MSTVSAICLVIILVILWVGIVIWFLVSTQIAFRKFNYLEKHVQKKLVLLEYYMVFIRRLSTNELIKIASLSDDEIIQFNGIHDWNERIKIARERITK